MSTAEGLIIDPCATGFSAHMECLHCWVTENVSVAHLSHTHQYVFILCLAWQCETGRKRALVAS